jgi:metal-responsive CopG/Arc/MetJ family transcriptional regulator
MKTAVSIPDPVFDQAEALARRLQKSRSQLYSEALAEYLLRHDEDAITEATNAVCDALDSPQDSAFATAAVRILERTEW